MISHSPLASLVAPFPYLDSILFDQEEILQKSLEIGVLDKTRLEFVASLRILPYLDGIICFEELFGRIERVAAVQRKVLASIEESYRCWRFLEINTIFIPNFLLFLLVCLN